MVQYKKKLESDLPAWVERGWVTEKGAQHILADVGSRGLQLSFANLLGFLGGILLCLGALVFVAANWEGISKLGRLCILFAALWVSYGAAIVLQSRHYTALAQAALLGAVGMFGACIMLVSQTYHIDGHGPDAVFLWALGALATGLLTRSGPVLGLSLILFGLWHNYETGLRSFYYPTLNWAFLPWWALASAGIVWTRWRPGYHLSLLSFLLWFAALGFFEDVLDLSPPAFVIRLAVLLFALGMGGAALWSPLRQFDRALIGYGFAITVALLFFLQGISPLKYLPESTSILGIGFSLLVFLLSAGVLQSARTKGALSASDFQVSLAIAALPFLFSLPLAEADGMTMLVIMMVIAAGQIAFGIWAIRFGWKLEHGILSVLGYILVGAELLYIYIETLGGLLSTSLFYTAAGMLLIGLSVGFTKLHRRTVNTEEKR